MHAGRVAYYVVDEGPITEPEYLSSAGAGCPMAEAEAMGVELKCPPVKFGRMFPPRWGEEKSKCELSKIAAALTALGRCMDNPKECHKEEPGEQEESDIPAGYTYFGQFITHEITFDDTNGLPLIELKPKNIRSPSLDLDSLYGKGPGGSRELYEEVEHPARLRVGRTQPPKSGVFTEILPFDLPREEEGSEKKKKGVAIVGDERNEENLPLAQTHVAFLKFHNRVVEDLKSGEYKSGGHKKLTAPPDKKLFDTAREEVVRHFQWVVLKDYLPRIVDADLIESLTRKPSDRFNPQSEDDLFIPLEFSAAAFRIGHSMVRRRYMYNSRHKDVLLEELFTHTKRSGNLNGLDRLDSTWVIDWKRFYDFTPFAADYPPPYDPFPYDPQQSFNKAGRIDTVFDLHLRDIVGFNHSGLPAEIQPITVRNLLRGLALGLPWGEDLADAMGEGQLERKVLTAGPHAELLKAEPFEGKTPLWFYVLKESKLHGNGGRLGRVGGRIVAETLIGLIRHSRHSILRRVEGAQAEWELSDWRPAYGRPTPEKPERVKFEMVDLLRAAGAVDPLGKLAYEDEHG